MIASPALWTPRARGARRIIEATRSRADAIASTRSEAPQPHGIAYTWPASGMLLAWRADLGLQLSGSNVTGWTDQILGYKLVQGSGGVQPSVAPTLRGSIAALGGAPGVDFSGDTNAGFSTPSGVLPALPAIGFDYGIFAVVVTDAGSSSFDVWLSTRDATYGTTCETQYGGGPTNALAWQAGFTNQTKASLSAPVGAGAAIGVGLEAHGGQLYWNSPTPALNTYANPFGEGIIAGNSPFVVGNRPNGGQRAFGALAELVIARLPTFDFASWFSVWVAGTYGLPITP